MHAWLLSKSLSGFELFTALAIGSCSTVIKGASVCHGNTAHQQARSASLSICLHVAWRNESFLSSPYCGGTGKKDTATQYDTQSK